MKKACVTILLLFTACTPAAKGQALLATPAWSGDLPVQTEPAATPTQTATLLPTATFDPALAVTSTALAQENERLANSQTQVALGLTQGAATAQADIATSTAVFGAGFATSTVEVYRTEIAPTAITAKARADFDANAGTAGIVVVSLVIVMVFFASVTVVTSRARVAEYQAYRDAHPGQPQPEQPEPRRIIIETRKNAGNDVRWDELPISETTFVQVVNMLQNGDRYTQAQMTGDGKPLSKSNGTGPGTFDLFGAWMVANGFAIRQTDGRYILLDDAAHRMEKYPHLPPADFSPI